MDFAELLAAASQALSAPDTIVGRSARARATAEGVAPEQILAQWAGIDAGSVAAPPAAAASEVPASDSATESVATTAAPPSLDVEVVAPQAHEQEPEPEPEREPEPDPEELPEEVLVGAAGIKVTKRQSLPRWLAASFVVVPLVALFYAATFAGGPGCGNGGALAIDEATGVAENCDGSEFGSLGGNPLKLGAQLYTVGALPACQNCHGVDGGGGTGPALAGVAATFPSCADHIKWVTLGTARWRTEEGDTYGASNKPVGGGGIMQPYEAGLTPEEIAAVVLFERVTYGGLDPVEATDDCFSETEAAG